MSQHSSFTSEYIYCLNDYKILRKRATECEGYLCLRFFPEADDNLPIISGKVVCHGPHCEDMVLDKFLNGVVTEYAVTFFIVNDGYDIGEQPFIQRIVKYPDGETELSHWIERDDDLD